MHLSRLEPAAKAIYDEEARRHALLPEKRRRTVMNDIERIARAGEARREFAAAGGRLPDITGGTYGLAKQAMH